MKKVLSLEYEYEHDYVLIGINSALEEYRMAYLLNKNLNLKLKRKLNDLKFTDKNCSFSIYDFYCKTTFLSWSFLINKSVSINQTSDQENLFAEESKTSFLIQEKKRIDYFLKIDGDLDYIQTSSILKNIKNINGVIASYAIEPQTLKSKDYLIF